MADNPSLEVHPIRTSGLGNNTFVVTHDDIGVLVDPQRDIERFLAVFDSLEVEPRWILETHIHNDYVSGGLQAARATGAELLIPASADPAFTHTSAADNQEFRHRDLSIRSMHTPGHTPEHTSYQISFETQPLAVFSGGSLLVGSAGRSDLLGAERAQELARHQYHSVQRLAALPPNVGLYPTHGAGSFCTVSTAGRQTSTIGEERLSNPVLAYPDIDSFVAGQLDGLQPYPTYYRHMAAENLIGGGPMPELTASALHPREVPGAEEVAIVDIRDRYAYASGHIPGSLGIELGNDFASWVGWLVEFKKPIVLVVESHPDPNPSIARAITDLARIGYDNVVGALWGLDDWQANGGALASYRTAGVAELADALSRQASVLDVRAPSEYAAAHIDGSHYRYLPDLVGAPMAIGPEVWVICASGFRATVAAGMLEQQGLEPVVVARGGVQDVLARL